MEKIGCAIITCDRVSFFEKCIKSLPENIDYLVVVNDGKESVKDIVKDLRKCELIEHAINQGVTISKNDAFKSLLKQKDIKDFFIIEDDIIIKKSDVFEKYITASKLTGIQHMNFGLHGPANKNGISGGKPCPRFVIDYGNIKIAIYQHCVGAFCYYTREVLEKVGLMDERLKNAFDHVDHSYRIAKAGYATPYWNWTDLANSYDYLDEIECSEKSSVIRPRSDWQENIRKSAEIFKQKHGVSPAWQNCVPDTSEEEVKRIMKEIYKKYADR